MNKKQCIILAWSSMILMVLFIGIDTMNNSCLDYVLDLNYGNTIVYSPYDTFCIVNSEVYEPFIILFFLLMWVFMICWGHAE